VLSQEGGWGETYVARDLDRPGTPRCVIKLLKPATQDHKSLEIAEDLFQREAETLEDLGIHERIPRLLAYFKLNGNFYLVQEFIDGLPLNNELVPGLQWSETKVINLLIEILDILTFVHSKDVIHRDIKPANLIRCRIDGKITLIDFGAVKKIRDPNAITQIQADPLTVSIGTRGYMPLEQFDGRPCLSSDIYALGIICIQALTGMPIDALSRYKDDENLWKNYVSASEQLINIVDRMARPYYRDRYKNAKEVLSDIEKAFPEKVELHRASYTSDPEPIDIDDIYWEEDASAFNQSPFSPTKVTLITLCLCLITFPVAFLAFNLQSRLQSSKYILSNSKYFLSISESFHLFQIRLIFDQFLKSQSSTSANEAKFNLLLKSYVELNESLRVQNWESADQITFTLLLTAVSDKSRAQGRFVNSEWEAFLNNSESCTLVKNIDSLWTQASGGKLGFSAQRRVFKNSKNFQSFYEQIRWLEEGSETWLVSWDYDDRQQKAIYEKTPDYDNAATIEGYLPGMMEWEPLKDGRFLDQRFLLFGACEL
jgi:serine/threonine protein kinase